uniref:Protein kinase domain-containing protein n=1 Tax=Trieres chinensis TaxID=1514140 RepID=A0A7S2A9P9_TRICV|mmetsp:Transcript_870/g.1735  ORF Transcript_870/g.1735 Transcript_870/m.1735 type:complete len:109 (+) Transcript_870:44-370(+)
MSPELCAGKAYDGKLSDLYAVGATMFCIRCGHPPFMSNPLSSPSNQLYDLYERIQKDPITFSLPVAEGLRSVIEQLMMKDPTRRSSLAEVMRDQWLQHRPVTNSINEV